GGGGSVRRCLRYRRRGWLWRDAAFHSHRERFAAQGYILFLGRIEITKQLSRDFVLPFVRAHDRLKCLYAADPDFVILLELGRGRILVPAAFVFERRRRDAIEISPAGDRCRDRERVT